jgi:hypothetical protein
MIAAKIEGIKIMRRITLMVKTVDFIVCGFIFK